MIIKKLALLVQINIIFLTLAMMPLQGLSAKTNSLLKYGTSTLSDSVTHSASGMAFGDESEMLSFIYTITLVVMNFAATKGPTSSCNCSKYFKWVGWGALAGELVMLFSMNSKIKDLDKKMAKIIDTENAQKESLERQKEIQETIAKIRKKKAWLYTAMSVGYGTITTIGAWEWYKESQGETCGPLASDSTTEVMDEDAEADYWSCPEDGAEIWESSYTGSTGSDKVTAMRATLLDMQTNCDTCHLSKNPKSSSCIQCDKDEAQLAAFDKHCTGKNAKTTACQEYAQAKNGPMKSRPATLRHGRLGPPKALKIKTSTPLLQRVDDCSKCKSDISKNQPRMHKNDIDEACAVYCTPTPDGSFIYPPLKPKHILMIQDYLKALPQNAYDLAIPDAKAGFDAFEWGGGLVKGQLRKQGDKVIDTLVSKIISPGKTKTKALTTKDSGTLVWDSSEFPTKPHCDSERGILSSIWDQVIGISQMVKRPKGCVLFAGIGTALTGYLAYVNFEKSKEAEERAKKIQGLIDKLVQAQVDASGAASTAGVSPAPSKIYPSATGNDPIKASGYKQFSENTTCVDINGNPDPNCNCKRMINSAGESSCMSLEPPKTTNAVMAELSKINPEITPTIKALNSSMSKTMSGDVTDKNLSLNGTAGNLAAHNKKINTKLLNKLNEKRVARGEKPIAINDKLANDFANNLVTPKLASSVKNSPLGKGPGMSGGGLLSSGSQAGGAETTAADETGIVSAKLAAGGGGKRSLKKSKKRKRRKGLFSMGDFMMDSGKKGKKRGVAGRRYRAARKLNLGDISKKKDKSIFKTISDRYKYTGIPKVLLH